LSSGGVRAVLSARANELVRLSMVHLLSGAVPLYVINEFPKSGGTWVGQMLGRALRVPFPRNRFPVLRPSIMHGHYLSPFGVKNAVAVWRDGRDVMVSWYHQQLLPHEHRNDAQVERTRREVSFKDYENVYENLPAFIEYAFTKPHSPSFSWTDFVHRWHQLNNVVHVRYEDARRDTSSPSNGSRDVAPARRIRRVFCARAWSGTGRSSLARRPERPSTGTPGES